MKQIKLLFAFLFLFSIKSNAQYFEGIITYQTTETPQGPLTEMYNDTTWKHYIKGEQIRKEYSGQFFDWYVINTNTKSGDIVIQTIDTIQKYVEIVIEKVAKDEEYCYDKNPQIFKRRKRKDMKILGYNCKHYYSKDSYSRYDFWITDSIIPQINSFGTFIKDRGIILKSIHVAYGVETVEEAVSIEPKTINSELFKIPADCKPKNSKSLIKGMKKYGVDEKLIPRDSLKHVKDTTKMDFGKWGADN